MPLLSRIWFALFFALLFSPPRTARADDIRQVNVAVNGIVFNPADGKLYCGGASGSTANSIVPLDPQTATLGTAVSLGAAPQDMVISSDGRFVDSVLEGRTKIRRFDTKTQLAGVEWGLGHDYSDLYAEDIAALPGSPGTVLVSRANFGLSPRHKDIVAYDDGVLRVTPNRAAGANFIKVNESGTRLYGYFAEISSFDFERWDIDANGFSNGTDIHPISGFNLNFKYAGGRAYASNGLIFDPESGKQLGNFSSQSLDLTVPDPKTGRLITATQTGTNLTIQIQNVVTLAPLGSIVVPGVSGSAGKLVRWGINGLAFRTATQVFLVRSSLISVLPPTLSGVSPSQARIGDAVTITGTELTTTSSVQFNGVQAAFHIDSDLQITAFVPVGATSGVIRVTTEGGSAETSPFTVLMPTIRVDDASVAEGDSGSRNLDFIVTLSYPSRAPVSFDFAAQSNTATEGSDFESSSGSRSFAPGQTSQVISVPVLGDTSSEADETLILQLSNVVGALTQVPAPFTMVRNDSNGHFYQLLLGSTDWEGANYSAGLYNYLGVAGHLATITSAEEDAFITENFGNMILWLGGVQASGSTEPSGGFGWVTGEDFTYTNWNAGEPNNANGGEDVIQRTNFNQWNDVSRQARGLVVVEYDIAPGATGPDPLAVGTILNDDTLPKISISDVTILEGNSGTTNAKFSVSLSNDSSSSTTVYYATENGSAVAGQDYRATRGSLTFAPGETSKEVSVPVLGDVVDEEDETFTLRLDSPTNASIENATGICTITDDDTSGFSVDSPSLNEGNSGVSALKFTIKLSASSSRTIRLNYRTATSESPTTGDSATPDVDYISVPLTSLAFKPGEVSKTVSVSIKGDTQSESNERLTLFVTGVENIQGSANGVGTILDDDQPTISINSPSIKEGNSGTTPLVFTLTLSQPSTTPVSVVVTTSQGTALATSDYRPLDTTPVTFAPGQTQQNVTVLIYGDTLVEPDEQFRLALRSPSGATLEATSGTGTILNDDLASISVQDIHVQEGNSGTTSAIFTVTLSNPSTQTVTVKYATQGASQNSAAPGYDYIAASGTLTFAPGEKSKTVTVLVKGDTLVEPSESFVLKLTAPVNATIADATGLCTIVNDDSLPKSPAQSPQSTSGSGSYS